MPTGENVVALGTRAPFVPRALDRPAILGKPESTSYTPERVLMHCNVFLPASYARRGPAETCARLVAGFQEAGLGTTLWVARLRAEPIGIAGARDAANGLTRRLPWRYVQEYLLRRLEKKFLKSLTKVDPAETALIFWPDTPIRVLKAAKARGFFIAREMINSACATAKVILDDAYALNGLPATHIVTQELAATETEELALYDAIFSPNDLVDQSLRQLGVDERKILRTSFGWDPDRFDEIAPRREADRPDVHYLFVGSIGVRKGVFDLLAAWEMAGRPGTLHFAGAIEPDVREVLDLSTQANVVHHDFTPDMAKLYGSADVFIFPSLEEGGPQVTYEAAAFGLPVITTDVCSSRFLEDDLNALIVPAGDRARLAEAIGRMAREPKLRRRLGSAAQRDVQAFRYGEVARKRVTLLRDRFSEWTREARSAEAPAAAARPKGAQAFSAEAPVATRARPQPSDTLGSSGAI